MHVNTDNYPSGSTVRLSDGFGVEPNRSAGAQTAGEARLVSGETRGSVATTWLEHQPGFAGQLGTAAAQGA